jgi:hypothetical protein
MYNSKHGTCVSCQTSGLLLKTYLQCYFLNFLSTASSYVLLRIPQLLHISDRAELFISLAGHNAVSQSLVKTVHSDINVSKFF